MFEPHHLLQPLPQLQFKIRVELLRWGRHGRHGCIARFNNQPTPRLPPQGSTSGHPPSSLLPHAPDERPNCRSITILGGMPHHTPHNKMTKQLTRIGPLRAGIVLGVLYGIFSLIIMPFVLLAFFIGGKAGTATPAFFGFGLGFAIMLPVLYAAVGFIGGIIAAAIYNLVAKWTGGLEFEVRDVPPAP